MRLIALDVVRFGALSDRRFELDGRAFALEGPNEAGKSSFHTAVETLFYGFHPASRDAHPYATWSTETGSQRTTLHLIGLVELGDGRRLQVERRLASRAELRVAAEGEELTGPWRKNVTLEELQAIPRPLFRAVYSLTANEIQEPDDSGIQELVDDLLLGDKGLVGARPVRELRAEIAAERAALWRPTRRGETEESRLALRKKELLSAQREASDAERRRSEADAELDEVRDRAEALQEELTTLEADIEDARICAELAMLERAERELPRVDLSDLGRDAIDPTELARRVERAAEACSAPRARLERDAAPRPERQVALAQHQEHIAHLASESAEDRHDTAEVERHERDARAAAARADELVHGLLARSDDDRAERAPIEALAEGARAWRIELDDARAALDARSRIWWPAIVALVIGAAIAGAALGGWVPEVVGAGGLALLVLCGAWLLLRRPPEMRRLDELVGAPNELAALVEDAGLASTILADPDAVLRATGALDEARELRASAAEAGRAADRARARRDERRERWRGLAATVGLEGADDLPYSALPKALGEQLAEARAALEHADRDVRERSEASRELQRHEAAHATLREQLEELTRALRDVLPDVADPGQAWRELGQLAQERARLDGARRQLSRAPRFAALEHDPRRAVIETEDGDAPAEPFWSERLQTERAERREALKRELGEAQRLAGELTERAKQLPPADAATIASELHEVDRQLEHTRREHDRLALIERALVVGERRFRADHQPDILRTASAHLGRITGGRYDRIEYPDPEAPTLHVRSAELGELVPVGPPLSRGVREQVHLCLRLGTLEHLDRGRETLPLVLDEALVHWDPPRRAALYEVLQPLTEERQVILLTCQPELAEEAARLLGARHVSLLSSPRAAVER